MTKEAIDAAIGEWYFRQDKYGDWRGFHEDGRRTALKSAKGKYTGLQFAQNDVLNGRIVCKDWPIASTTSTGSYPRASRVVLSPAGSSATAKPPAYEAGSAATSEAKRSIATDEAD